MLLLLIKPRSGVANPKPDKKVRVALGSAGRCRRHYDQMNSRHLIHTCCPRPPAPSQECRCAQEPLHKSSHPDHSPRPHSAPTLSSDVFLTGQTHQTLRDHGVSRLRGPGPVIPGSRSRRSLSLTHLTPGRPSARTLTVRAS